MPNEYYVLAYCALATNIVFIGKASTPWKHKYHVWTHEEEVLLKNILLESELLSGVAIAKMYLTLELGKHDLESIKKKIYNLRKHCKA